MGSIFGIKAYCNTGKTSVSDSDMIKLESFLLPSQTGYNKMIYAGVK